MQRRHALFLALAATLVALPAASQKAAKNPPTNLYIDVSTQNMAGMPDMGGMLGGLGGFMAKRMGGNALQFGKSNAKIYMESQTGKTFADGEVQRIEVLRAADGGHDLHHEVFREGVDDGLDGATEDDRHRQFEHVARGDELLELLDELPHDAASS